MLPRWRPDRRLGDPHRRVVVAVVDEEDLVGRRGESPRRCGRAGDRRCRPHGGSGRRWSRPRRSADRSGPTHVVLLRTDHQPRFEFAHCHNSSGSGCALWRNEPSRGSKMARPSGRGLTEFTRPTCGCDQPGRLVTRWSRRAASGWVSGARRLPSSGVGVHSQPQQSQRCIYVRSDSLSYVRHNLIVNRRRLRSVVSAPTPGDDIGPRGRTRLGSPAAPSVAFRPCE